MTLFDGPAKLPKTRLCGSIPQIQSNCLCGETADTAAFGSPTILGHAGSNPAAGTLKPLNLQKTPTLRELLYRTLLTLVDGTEIEGDKIGLA